MENKSTVNTIRKKERFEDFLVKDDFGLAYVNVQNAEVYLKTRYSKTTGLFQNATPEIEIFMKKNGSSHLDFWGLNSSLIYHESYLSAGDTISVLGYGKWVAAESLVLPSEYAGKKILYPNPERNNCISERVFKIKTLD